MAICRYKVTMELLSDTIFGSGFSIPGGEDISVYEDDHGFPYLKGSTLKGLLRESLTNLLNWSGVENIDHELKEMLGASGGDESFRRVQVTSLTLLVKPKHAEDCYALRSFTALEEGVAKEGTLRTARCIRRGLKFCGETTYAEGDEEWVKDAFAGIKWAGVMRNRGFGRVRITAEPISLDNGQLWNIPECRCIYYKVKSELPLIFTDSAASHENNSETKGYIPGSAVRGMVINALAKSDPEWFEKNKTLLLSDRTRFLNAFPVPEGLTEPVLPSIKGFYENKAETSFETVVKNGSFTAGFKRAKIGQFCTIKDKKLCYWSAEIGETLRIQRDNREIFHTNYLSAGQEFEGYILLDNVAFAPKIAETFCQTVWLGADRYQGFGKCSALEVKTIDAPRYSDYSASKCANNDKALYMLLLSPMSMLDECGRPCGIDKCVLAQKLGVNEATVKYSSTSISEYDSFNATWKCRFASVRMYDSGSIFKVECDKAPDSETLKMIERDGIGIRRAEGFGQVLFIHNDLFEGISEKEKIKKAVASDNPDNQQAKIRRARCRWIMEQAINEVSKFEISASQLGNIQSQCERAIEKNGNIENLPNFLTKNLDARGARHGDKFIPVNNLINKVLNLKLSEIPGVTVEDRLQLLCDLFDYSRKL